MSEATEEKRHVPPVIRDKAFAKRLETACEANPHCPTDEYRGKQKWLYTKLEEDFGIKVSPEAVRKWFAGETKPRPKVMVAVARILEVDIGWLQLGIKPDQTNSEKKVRNAQAEGAVNALAGFIQMAGSSVAFPEKDGEVDMFAIVAGRQHQIEANLALSVGMDQYRFIINQGHEDRTVIGIIKVEDAFALRFVRITSEMIEKQGTRRGDFWELVIDQRADRFASGEMIAPEIVNLRELDGVLPKGHRKSAAA